MKIAICGKGGVGKTTFCAVLARALASKGERVVAIDADPNANLALALGFDPILIKGITPLAEMKEIMEERTGKKDAEFSGYFKLNPKIDDLPERFSLTQYGVRLIILGGIPKAYGGCFCPENTLLRNLIKYLFSKIPDSVIIDMEAGLEHLSRGTAESMEIFIIIVEPTLVSILTAKKIQKMAEDLGVSRVCFLGNKIASEDDKIFVEKELPQDEIIGFLSLNPKVLEAERKRKSCYELCKETRDEVEEIFQRMASKL